MIELDLQDGGIDMGDRAMLRNRSWRWLSLRIIGLLHKEDTRLRSVIFPRKEQQHLGGNQ